MNKYLAVLLSSSCLVACNAASHETNSAGSAPPKPIQLTKEQDEALVKAGILPPKGRVAPPATEKISPSKFSDVAVEDIMSIWDKQVTIFYDYRNKEIALWKTLDEEIAKKEQAAFDNEKLIGSLTRDSLYYRLTHPPVIIHMDKGYGGLIGMDAFDVSDDEDAAIDYNNRNEQYLQGLKSLRPTREFLKKKLSLQREHAELFEKLGDIWSETIPNLDQQFSDAIINNAQPVN